MKTIISQAKLKLVKQYIPNPEQFERIKQEVAKQVIFWSDDRGCHWFFDFKFEWLWISNHKISNELDNIEIIIYKPE